jgi:SnoaL-like domain
MTAPRNVPERRRFLATAGAGIAALVGSPQPAHSALPPAVDQRTVALVEKFLLSWSSDMKTVLSYLAEDCECRLSQWGPNRTGHAEIAYALATYVERPRTVVTTILDCSGAGPVVMAHYKNHYVYECGELIWEGVSTFFVEGEKIKEWRRYTLRVSNCSSLRVWSTDDSMGRSYVSVDLPGDFRTS